jgi:hypothetical protein
MSSSSSMQAPAAITASNFRSIKDANRDNNSKALANEGDRKVTSVDWKRFDSYADRLIAAIKSSSSGELSIQLLEGLSAISTALSKPQLKDATHAVVNSREHLNSNQLVEAFQLLAGIWDISLTGIRKVLSIDEHLHPEPWVALSAAADKLVEPDTSFEGIKSEMPNWARSGAAKRKKVK